MSTIEKALDSLGGGSKRSSPKENTPAVEQSVESAPTSRPHKPQTSLERQAVSVAAETPADAMPRRALDDAAGVVSREAAGPGGVDSMGNPKPYVTIPLEALDAAGFLTPLKPRSQIGEEFRGIKRPLLKNCMHRSGTQMHNANLIMVTSALQGDGKTFCSLNLALSIAMEQDKTVLFVDADVLKASAGRTLGVDDQTPGLIDLLSGSDYQPQDVILRTSMPKLRILPAGRKSEHATEILASGNMHALMIELAERYHDRVIVFDSPPLLLTTEASVLASFMGQIVFVASAEKTPESAVRQALEHLGEDKMVGVVMNRASRAFNPFGYGYGYGYGYGSGERESEDAVTDEVGVK